jgi:hypothetical protein
MARFKWLGELPVGGVEDAGPCSQLALPRKTGGPQVITPVPPATEFVVGQDIGYEITDSRSLLALRADPRFAEV